MPGVRENGGQYTHAAVWATHGVRRAGRRRARLGAVRADQPGAATASTSDAIATYKVEPYVVAGDVYALAPHAGRGGWTWYTGSAGWMYQLLVDALLGLRRTGNALLVHPLLPRGWKTFEMRYRFGASTYDIACRKAESADAAGVMLDGIALPDETIAMIDDGRNHSVAVTVWREP